MTPTSARRPGKTGMHKKCRRHPKKPEVSHLVDHDNISVRGSFGNGRAVRP